MKNRLCYGDCLEVMREHIGDESVNLIYLDPPFNSKRIYNAFIGGGRGKSVQFEAFNDTWRWSEAAADFHEVAQDLRLASTFEGLRKILGEGAELAYLSYLANRLRQCWRVLKPTGSIYLHCDPTMSHYLKVVMDGLFGKENFRNEIVWHYSGWNKRLKSHIERRHDILFFYSKTKAARFNYPTRPWESRHEYVKVRRQKVRKDDDGREYVLSDAGGGKRVKRYLDEAMEYGVPLDDVWDIPKLNNSDAEKTGYPTQKPVVLLERIIKASSNEGDVVLDPFCGCGTTVEAAERQQRRWIGIDICHRAYEIIEKRLKSRLNFVDIDFVGMPRTLESARDLARRNKFTFETWAASLVDGVEANKSQRGDKGIDGRGRLAVARGEFIDLVSQVKGGHTAPGDIQAFNGARQQAEADMGIFTCFGDRVTPRMRDTAASTGQFRGAPVIQIYTVDDWFNGKVPVFPKAA